MVDDDEKNNVESIKKSELFPKTVYVTYKYDFDFEKIKKKYEKRSSLIKIHIELMQTFETKIILVKLYDTNDQIIDKPLIILFIYYLIFICLIIL